MPKGVEHYKSLDFVCAAHAKGSVMPKGVEHYATMSAENGRVRGQRGILRDSPPRADGQKWPPVRPAGRLARRVGGLRCGTASARVYCGVLAWFTLFRGVAA